MSKCLEDLLGEQFADPAATAGQADIAQASALARQELSFRQRAGAAAAQVRIAKADGADPEEIAELEAVLNKRTIRLEAAQIQARAADIKRPIPDEALAQVFGRAEGDVEKPPLTAAALSPEGQVLTTAAAAANGSFHLTFEGDLTDVTLQVSDAAERVLYRGKDPVTIPAGTVQYLDVSLDPPKPEPGPVPAQPKMPELTGQSEGAAVAILCRIGKDETDIEIVDEVAEGQPGIVIGQSPKAGTVLGDETMVKLTVRRASAGSQGETFLPGLVGTPLAEAEKKLKELDLASSVTRQVDDGEPDMVMAQSPKEGTALKDVSTVALTVSRKPETQSETVTVPDLIGRSRDVALELIKATGLKDDLKETTESNGATGVVAQAPKAGTVVNRGTTVAFTVNTPPEIRPGRVVLPNLTGRKLDDAMRQLGELSLAFKAETAVNAAPEGQVIGQAPKAGSRVDAGSTVMLTVSRGPDGGSGGGRTGRGDLAKLVREMARDPRADEAGMSVERIGAMFRAGNVANLDDARALAKLAPQALRDRAKLGNQAAASKFRAILRKALKALG